MAWRWPMIALMWGALLFLMAPIAPSFAAAEITRITTPGGLEVWYTREPSVPIITVSLAFRGGSALDPAGRAGLATLAVSLLDEGAGTLDSQAFQRAVSDRAIRLNFDAGRDVVVANLSTISKHRTEAFRLLGLALTEPRFDAPAVERVRRQLLVSLANGENDPETVSARTWFHAVFPDHPYGVANDGTPEGVRAITVDDLRAFAAQRLARDNVVIGAAGDIAPEELATLIDGALGGLPAVAALHTPGPATLASLGETIVRTMAIPQSVVTFGLPGIERSDPDFYAAYVMNHILGGGGFTSRLYDEVRVKRGLVYSVYTYLRPLDNAALYLGGAATSNDRVAETIEVIRREIAKFAEAGATEAELDGAKRNLIGGFPLRFDNGAKIARMLVNLQLDSLGIDYFEHRNDLIDAVTLEDVQRVATRLLDPGRLTIVVVGAPEGLAPTP